MSRRPLIAALALVAASACGTTVPHAGAQSAAQGDGLGPPTSLGSGASSSPPGGRTGSSPGSSVTQLPTGPARTKQPATTAPPVPAGSGVGPRTPVSVGWVVLQSNANVAGSLGFADSTTPDQTPYAQAIVDWANAHGGLGGRPIKPVFWHMDASGSQSVQEYAATGCAFFTQDHHVDVVVDPSLGDVDAFVSCLDNKHLVHLDLTGQLDSMARDVVKHPLYLPADGIGYDTLAELEVTALAAQGFYGNGSKVGLITYDKPVFHAVVDQVLKPTLKARTGRSLDAANVAYLPPYASVSDTAAISAAVSNAVLRFRSNGVNRVIFLQNFSLATVEFMRIAENQGYRPRYGLSSNDSPQTDVGLAPAAQLRNVTGFGWRPGYDVASTQQLQPGRPACLSLFKAAKLTFTPGSASEAAAMRHCEGGTLLKLGADAAGGGLGPSLVQALVQQSPGFRSPTVLGISLTPQHHDGVAAYRNLAFNDACTCFRYTSGPVRIR